MARKERKLDLLPNISSPTNLTDAKLMRFNAD